MFRSCSKNVWSVKNVVFPKSFGDLWAMFWHHPRCLRAHQKIKKVNEKSKNNKITFENRKILSNVYQEDVKLLRETFKYDFSEWEDFKL